MKVMRTCLLFTDRNIVTIEKEKELLQESITGLLASEREKEAKNTRMKDRFY